MTDPALPLLTSADEVSKSLQERGFLHSPANRHGLFTFALEGRFPWWPELTIGPSGHSHSSVSEVRVLSAGLCLPGARGNFPQ